jgi:hypothetical protein
MSHAWDWFSVHASQRLQVFNFFGLTSAFLVAAFVSAHGDRSPGLAAAVAAAGFLASVGYNLVEQRTKALVQAGEAAIAPLEARLATALEEPTIEIVVAVERPGHRLTKYSFVFNALQRGAAVAWLVAALYESNRYW